MAMFIEAIISGILIGVSYAVLAAGLALILGVMKIINFAHAEFAVLAMYFPTYWFLNWWGIDPFHLCIYRSSHILCSRVHYSPAVD